MIEAALTGSMGSWSPSAILAGFGNAVDGPSDGAGDVRTPTGPAAAFERALAAELQRAGDLDPYNAGSFDPQNGAALSRASDARSASWTDFAADSVAGGEADDAMPSVLAERRVAFGDQDAPSRRLTADVRSSGFGAYADGRAFWVGDRVAIPSASVGSGLDPADMQLAEPVYSGRIFFNGDGRPILLASLDGPDHDPGLAADRLAPDGDLMILPNGAVLSYDPWTAAADVSISSPSPH